MKIAVIQLARYGDIVNILPICKLLHDRGDEVHMYVHEDFADILDNLDYVKSVVWNTQHRDVAGATSHAQAQGYDEILVTQYDGNPVQPPTRTESYQPAAWARIGHLEKFHELQLLFPLDLMTTCPKPNMLGVCLHSMSSPFFNSEKMMKWVRETFDGNWIIRDFSTIKVDKIQKLIPLIAECGLLLTVDTLHLHLSHATGTPTVALQRPRPWDRSEPRKHWVGKFTYPEIETPSGLDKLASMINTHLPAGLIRPPAAMITANVGLVIHRYQANQPQEIQRCGNAAETWFQALSACPGSTLREFSYADAKRTSKSELSDTRALVYVKDVIDFCADQMPDNDVICYTNTDICLTRDALVQVQEKLKTCDACFSARVDMPLTEAFKRFNSADFAERRYYSGTDLFAFRKSWWIKNKSRMGDLILGCEGWDWVLRQLIRLTVASPAMYPPVCFHAVHPAFWAMPENVQKNPGQIYCRKICEDWCRKNGLEAALYPSHMRYLFKPDADWQLKKEKKPLEQAVPAH